MTNDLPVTDVADDIKALATSYRRNRDILLDALQRTGQPSSWLNGWERKLDRMEAQVAKAESYKKGEQI